MQKKKNEIREIHSLTPMQQGMLFHWLMDRDSGAYHEQITFTASGRLDTGLFEKTFNLLVERYGILRTVFDYRKAKKPVQMVLKGRPVNIRFEDISSYDRQRKAAVLEETREQDRAKGFDLGKDVPMRIIILQTGPETYRVTWSYHHIIMDGWSFGILLADFFAIYKSLRNGKPLTPGSYYPYSDYIRWLQKQDKGKAAAYWKAYLGESAGGHGGRLSAFAAPGSGKKFLLKEKRFTIGRIMTDRLSRLAEIENVTVNTIFQAIWGILLLRYSRSRDVVFGSVVSGRSARIKGIERMVGLFINTIPVRVRARENISFSQFVQGLQKEALESSGYEYYPLSEIQSAPALKKDFIDHIMVFENYPLDKEIQQLEDMENIGFRLSDVKAHEQTNYDFDFTVFPGKETTVSWNYNASVYTDEGFIHRMSGHFKEILCQCLENPGIRLEKIQMLTPEEKHRLVYEFNDTQSAYTGEKTVHQLFEEQTGRMGDRVALSVGQSSVVSKSVVQVTYRELNEKSNRLAWLLNEKGVKPDTIVGIMLEPSVEMITGILGILKAGGAYMPIDPEYPQERIDVMLKDSGASILLTLADFFARSLNSSEGRPFPPATCNLHLSLAYIIYTSGTTGKPKGVAIEHRNAAAYIHAFLKEFPLCPNDVLLQHASFTFDAFVEELYPILSRGGKIVIAGKEKIRDIRLFAGLIEDNQVTVLSSSPLLINELNRYPGRLESIRLVVSGGDVLRGEYIGRLRLHAAVYNTYGPTESTVCATFHEVTGTGTAIPIGRPIANYRVFIMDDNFHLLPVGIPGELCIAGAGTTRGYLNNPELTAKRVRRTRPICGGSAFARSDHLFPLRPSPLTLPPSLFTPHPSSLYKTGDLARWLPDGNIEFLGRIDNQVNIRGFRIEVEEIENHLLKYPGIIGAAVIDKEDGAGVKSLYAYFSAGNKPEPPALREFLAGRLPVFMIPAYFIRIGRLPRDANGKVDRKALRRKETAISRQGKAVPPADEVEHALAAIWSEVLGSEKVSVHDNFFTSGGDSIKAIQVAGRLHKRGLKMEMKDLFTYPSIRALRPHIKEAKQETAREVEVVGGDVPLTPIQHWFFQRQKTGMNRWNQAVMFFNGKGFDERAVRRVLAEWLRHHDALRMVYRSREGKVIQHNRGPEIDNGRLYDFRSFSMETLTGAELEARVSIEAGKVQAGLHLEKGPLAAAALFITAEGGHLLLVIHHLVVDGVSWRILGEDFAAGYEQALSGETPRFQPKTGSFKSWAQKLLQYAAGKPLLKELEYWRKTEEITPAPLPRDRAAPSDRVRDGRTTAFNLSAEKTGQLLKEAGKAYGTEIDDLLLTALGLALKEWTGRDTFLVQMEGHGREPIIPGIDLTRTVGWFTSLYPVVLDMRHTSRLSRQVPEIKETLRRIPNKGVGYGILKYLTPEELKGGTAFRLIPEISFNYMGQLEAIHTASVEMSLSTLPVGGSYHPDSSRDHVFDINAEIMNGQLRVTLNYNKNEYKEATIAGFIDSFRRNLIDVTDHCLEREDAMLTPSDVGCPGLSLAELDGIVSFLKEAVNKDAAVKKIYPLTPMQEGMLFHALKEPDSPAYFEQTSFEVEGELDAGIFQEAFDCLLERYDVLRTVFCFDKAGKNLQVVLQEREGAIYYEDISALAEEERKNYLEVFLEKDRARGFRLDRDLLLRAAVLRTGSSSHHITWSFHHILMDGWCMGIVLEDIFHVYNGLRAGNRNNPMPRPVYPYSDYIGWLERQDMEAAGKYWKNYLSDEEEERGGRITTLGSPIRGEEKPFRPMSKSLIIAAPLVARMRELAGRGSTTLNTFIQSCWGILLQRYSNSRDVVFGGIVSGRPAEVAGIEKMVGLFINTIPVRIRIPSLRHTTFSQLMKTVGQGAVDSLKFQFYPLAEIQALTAQKQELIDHILVFENYPLAKEIEQMGEQGLLGFRIHDVRNFEQIDYDFHMVILPGREMTVTWNYNEAVFSHRDLIDRMVGHFDNILRQCIEDADIPLDRIDILTPQEKQQLVYQFNDTAAEYPGNKTVQQLFEEQTAKMGDRAALAVSQCSVVSKSVVQVTYRELNEKSNRLADSLKEKGVKPDTIVGIMLERSIEMIIGILGILKAGGAYMPIDPDYPQERIDFMLKDSGASILLTLAEFFARSLNSSEGRPFPPATCNLHLSLAYIIYTSGTTGKPKGVIIEHRNAAAYIHAFLKEFPLSPNDVLLQHASYTFDAFFEEMFPILSRGGKMVIAGKEKIRDIQLFTGLIEDSQVTVISSSPLLLNELNRYPGRLGSIRLIISGGDVLRGEYINRLRLRAAVYNTYGPTESTVCATFHKVTGTGAAIPIGRPIANYQVFIMDDSLHLLPMGIPGEICIAGAGTTRGYLNNPELTAVRFHPSPFTLHPSSLYKTGDLGRWLPDGNIEFLGRIDNQVKIRGFRIELGEIESHLLKYPGIIEAAVIDKEDVMGVKSLYAYFSAGSELEPPPLREFLAARLPVFMIPAVFTRVDRLPRDANGKVDRKALRRKEAAISRQEKYVPPADEVEHALAEIWSELLGSEKVSVHDNFFTSGGDSIKAIQVAGRLQKQGLKMEMKDLFKYPSIRALRPHIKEAKQQAVREIIGGDVPLTPIQHWFFQRQKTGMNRWNQAVMFFNGKGFDETVVRRVLAEWLRHHDALRMVYRTREGKIIQHNRGPGIDDGGLYDFRIFSMEALSGAELEARVSMEAGKVQAGLHLEKGPLAAAALFKTAEGDHLLLVIHHLVVDGVSWRILGEDFAAGYEQALAGETPRFQPKTDSFKSWAEKLRQYAGDKPLLKELEYWRKAEEITPVPLPRDRAVSSGCVRDGRTAAFTLSAEKTGQLLKETGRAYGTEIEDLLLTALGLALKEWTGRDIFPVHMEGHGREPIIPGIDLTRTVGWFTSLYPVVLDMRYASRPSRQVPEIKETLRRVPNKGVGYGILKYLTPEKLKGGTALQLNPEISFNYMGQLGAIGSASVEMSLSTLPVGDCYHPDSSRNYVFDINAEIMNGQLRVTLNYNKEEYKETTIAGFMDSFRRNLIDVTGHCVERKDRKLTPSDVGCPGLSLAELDGIVSFLKEAVNKDAVVKKIYPLTPMQEGMLFHALKDPESPVYFEQTSFEVEGELDAGIFREAFDCLLERYDVLRTVFCFDKAEKNLQVVLKERKGAIYYEDISALAEEKRKRYIEDFLEKDRARGFRLDRDLLLRAAVLRTGVSSHHITWSFHHILMDGWCMGIVLEDIFHVYNGLRAGNRNRPMLQPVNPYSDYIGWLERQDMEEAGKYWQNYLSDEEEERGGRITTLGSPVRGEEKPFRPMSKSLIIAAPLVAKMRELAGRGSTTLNTFIQSCWGILLQRYSGSRDVVFGSVVSGRPAEVAGIEKMVGLFINTIPVRIRIRSRRYTTFSQLMKTVGQGAVDSLKFQFYPLAEIQSLTAQKQELIDHILVFENYPLAKEIEQMGEQGLLGFRIHGVRNFTQIDYDFHMVILPGRDMTVTWNYNEAVFSHRDLIDRMVGHFDNILRQCIEDADIPLDRIDILTPQEKQQLVYQFNDTDAGYPGDKTLRQLFEEQSARRGDRMAVIGRAQGAGRRASVSYKELDERANQLAWLLNEKGVQPDSIVGIMVERSIEMIIGILGIIKAGGAYMPIDPDYPQERVDFMLKDSGTEILLTEDTLNKSFVGVQGAVFQKSPLAAGGNLAYIIYTSGTTGKPKGVLIEHRNVIRLMVNDLFMFDFDETDVWTMFHSYCFDFSVWEMYGALVYGGKVVIIPGNVARDTMGFLEVLRRERVTVLNQTPSAFYLLSREEMRSAAKELVTRYIIFGAEALKPQMLKHWREKYPQTRLVNMYGITETTVHVTYKEIGNREIQSGSSNIGRPIPTLSIYIMDKAMNIVPLGVSGEIYVGGQGTARGYLNRPELTYEKFRAFTLHPSPLYQTGDLGRWLPGGDIEYMGRIDQQVKLRGLRIELGEIENRLSMHPGIKDTVVIMREDESGDKFLCCYFVPDPADSLSEASELKKFLAAHLPGYMVPAHFVSLSRLPLTPNGKVDRKALPRPVTGNITGEYIAPAGEIEEKMAGVWSGILFVPREKISAAADFFELGGHSLKAIQLVSRIHQEFNVHIPIVEVFKSPDIRSLAAYVQQNAAAPGRFISIEPVGEQPHYPLSYAQQRLWTAARMDQGAEAYNIPGTYLLAGTLDREAMKFALETMMRRHESLRTTFVEIDGTPRMKIHNHMDTPLEEIDFSDGESRDNRVRGLIHREAHAVFDFEKGPLWRLKTLRLAGGRTLVLFNMHHIISDGWSMEILISEIGRLYSARVEKREISLPPLHVQYKDYVAWERKMLTTGRLEELKKFWHRHLDGEIIPLDLPIDNIRPNVRTFNGDHAAFHFDDKLTRANVDLVESEKVTLFAFYLSIFNVFLALICEKEEIMVASASAGREHAELENMIGFFTRSFVVKNYPAVDKRFDHFLKEVMERQAEAMANDIYPLQMVLEDLAANRRDREPLNVHLVVQRKLQEEPMESTATIREIADAQFESDLKFAKSELGLEVIEKPTGLSFYFEYNTDLFSRAKIELFAVWFRGLVEQVLENPGKTIGQYRLSGGKEKELFRYLGAAQKDFLCLLPLTPTQRDIYLLCNKNPGGKAMRLGFYMVMNKAAAAGRWEETLKSLHRIYPILGAKLIVKGDDLYFGIQKCDAVNFKYVDLSGREDFAGGETAVAETIEAISGATQDPANPLARHFLIRFKEDLFACVLDIHEIIFDAHSGKIFFEKLHQLLKHGPDDCPAGAVDSELYMTYRQSRAAKFDRESVKKYWGGMFSDIGKLQSNVVTGTGSRAVEMYLPIPDRHMQKIGAYCRRPGISVPLYFRGLYGLLIRLYCGARGNFPLREIIDGRDEAAAHAPGCFFQAVPLVFQQEIFNGGNQLNDYFQYIRARKKELLDNQYISILMQNQLLGREEIRFYYNYYSYFGKLDVENENYYMKVIKHFTDDEIHLRVGEGEDGFRLLLNYNEAFFNGRKFLDRLYYISEQVTDGAACLADLTYILPDEREEILRQLTAPAAAYPSNKTIHGLFMDRAAKTGDRVALSVVSESVVQVTYRELNDKSNRVAYLLKEKGVQPDTIVGIMAERSVEMISGILGILKAGGAYMPIDPDYPQDRIDFMLTDSGASILLTLAEFFARSLNSSEGRPFPPATCNLHLSLAYIIYTSGSTGTPKGVMIEHRSVVPLLVNDKFQFDFNAADVWTMFHSPCFDFSVWEMYGALLYGGKLIVIPKTTARDTKGFLAILKKQAVTVLNQTPSAFYHLLNEESGHRGQQLNIRYVIFGGETLSPAKLKGWHEKYPGTRLINMFGITETTVHVTFKEITGEEIAANSGSIGKPLPTATTCIVDRDDNLLPPGFSGELCVGGTGVARGYMNRPELTALKFTPHPSPIYKTGDLAHLLENGELVYSGRGDRQVQIRGFRVEPGEIEQRLVQSEGIDEAAVVVGESADGEIYLCAYLVSGTAIDIPELKNHLSKNLPYYMIPSFFVQLDGLPLTANGKVDIGALPEPVSSLRRSSRAPEDELEVQLASIWSQVLGIEKIGRDENFFDLGGHSLKATLLAAQIHKEMNRVVPLARIFQGPTIRELAEAIRETQAAVSFENIPKAPQQEYYILSSVQRRMYLAQAIEPGNLSYNMPMVVDLLGNADKDKFQHTLRQMIHRHESFRTAFRLIDGVPMQEILEAVDVDFEIQYHDCMDASGEKAKTLLREFVRPFDLSRPPQMRIQLLKIARENHIFMLDIHHIISDGTSFVVFFNELIALYEGQPLAPLRLQYKDYVLWQEGEARQWVIKQQEKYWLEVFRREPPLLELPLDFPRPEVKTFAGRHHHFSFDADLTAALKKLAVQEGTTLFMLLLALYNGLLAKITGQEDIVVGISIAGRRHADLMPIIGMFVNALPLRNFPAGNKTFKQFLNQLSAETLSAYENQDYPFELLAEKVAGPRNPGRNPVFDTMFVLNSEDEFDEIHIPGLSIKPNPDFENLSAQMDIKLRAVDSGDTVSLSFEYDTALFKQETIEMFVANFYEIAGAVPANPDIPLKDIKITTGMVRVEDDISNVEFAF